MTDFAIIGAGLAGLYAAHMLGSAGHSVTVYEAQRSLPNNHSAVLRFRDDSVGARCGIAFRPVNMIKTSAHFSNPVADTLSYSFKATGQSRSDRSLPVQPVVDKRYIAPPDFIARLAAGKDIRYGVRVDADWLAARRMEGVKVVSTIPLPFLANITGFHRRREIADAARSRQLWNYVATVADCDAYVSVYIPRPNTVALRASVTGDWLTIECAQAPVGPELAEVVTNDLGLDLARLQDAALKEQAYGKILPMDEHLRRQFLFWATDEWGVYSLGRFATWRPGLLMENLTRDITLIEQWASRPDGKYNLRLDRANQEARR